MKHLAILLLTATLLAAPSGCAQYRIGTRSLYPQGIETVYVPMIQSNSFRPGLGELVTEAVVKEIEKRTPYKVAGPESDSVLVGRIIGENKHLLVEARTGDPRAVEVTLHVQVTWQDNRGNILRQGPTIPVPQALVTVDGSSAVVPEVGQSIATGHVEATQKLAQQIVSLMEQPW